MVTALPVWPVPTAIPRTMGRPEGDVELTLLMKLRVMVDDTKPVSAEIPPIRLLDVSILMVFWLTLEFNA